MTIAQDSRQSWIMVAACFVIYCTNLGMWRISGLIFTESLHYYKADRKSTSFPFLMASVTRGIAAPMGGYLSYKFGYQFVVMLGSIISAIGIGTCFFAQDIQIVAAHWSIFGLGCGLAISLLPQIINLNFTKHATKANGIALSGPSIAGIMFPFFTVPLLQNYSVPGTYLNLGGILSHSIVGALLLRNHDSESSTNTNKNDVEISEKFHSNKLITKTNHIVDNPKYVASKYECQDPGCNNENKQHTKSLHELPNRKPFLCKNHLKCENDQNCSTPEHSALCEDLLDENSHESNAEEFIFSIKEAECSEAGKEMLILEGNTYHHSVKDLNSVESSNNINKENITVSYINHVIDLNKDVNARNKLEWTTSKNYQTNEVDFEGKLKTMNWRQICSIFWDPVFIIIAFSHSCIQTLCIVVPAILVDLANDKGIAPNLRPYLLTAFSTADLVAKLGLGWVIDGNYMPRCRYLALWFSIQSFAFGLMACSTGFVVITISVVFIGMVTGAGLTTSSRVTAQFIKKEKQAMAMASSSIFFIPMNLSMAPLIGHFRDQLGSYNGLLYIFVAASLLCTTLQLALPTIHHWKVKTKKVILHTSQTLKTDV